MDPSLLWRYLWLLFFSPLIVLIIHIIASRLSQRLSTPLHPQMVGGVAVLAGYPLMAFLAWWIALKYPSGASLCTAWMYGTIVYSCLAFCYIQCFNITETARRFHILQELKTHGGINRNDLNQRYSPTRMLATRFERMVEIKQLKKIGDRYALDNKLLYISAKIILAWTLLLGLPVKTGSST